MPQDPAAALNPALRIGTQLIEALEVHDVGGGGSERRERVAEMMREVALPDDAAYLRRYPHELSGGQQQRIGLAMAFACRPRVIVLDEPTTGLDVTTQAHVLETVRDLAAAHQVAALYVSHDLAVVGTLAARVAVMYAGRIVELGPAEELCSAPPPTRTPAGCSPPCRTSAGRRELVGIPGRAPSPGQRPGRLLLRAPLHDGRRSAAPSRCPSCGPWPTGHSARCVRAEEVRAQARGARRRGRRAGRGAGRPTRCSRSSA